MKVKQITLGSSTLVLAALLTACGGSSSSGVQKPTPLVANTNNSGNHGTTNHGNHGATNHGNHGHHGANNSGNHGTANQGHHGHHGTTNHGNHNANNPANPTPSNQAPKWNATVRYASLRNNAIKETNDYARKNFGLVPKNTGYTLSVDGKTQDGDIDLSKYPKGHSTLNIKETVTGEIQGHSDSLRLDSKVYLFKQDYSLIAGIHNQSVTLVSHQQTKPIDEIDFYTKTGGILTEKLPTTGKFNYSGSGKIWSQSGAQDAKFNYNVDFAAKTGSGSLGNITLSEDKIKLVKHDDSLDDEPGFQGVKGKATAGSLNGDYILGFYGPDAAEIVGSVELGDDKEHVGGIFGGTKQK